MPLKELLKAKGIKQKWFADQIGVSEVTVSAWCSEKSQPRKDNLQKISKILNVPMKSLLSTTK
jgi:repressor LexA